MNYFDIYQSQHVFSYYFNNKQLISTYFFIFDNRVKTKKLMETCFF